MGIAEDEWPGTRILATAIPQESEGRVAVNQNYGTTGIKHALAMLLMMALEDAIHQHPNIQYVASLATPPEVSTGSEAKWLRDLLLVVDPKVYEQIRTC